MLFCPKGVCPHYLSERYHTKCDSDHLRYRVWGYDKASKCKSLTVSGPVPTNEENALLDLLKDAPEGFTFNLTIHCLVLYA